MALNVLKRFDSKGKTETMLQRWRYLPFGRPLLMYGSLATINHRLPVRTIVGAARHFQTEMRRYGYIILRYTTKLNYYPSIHRNL